MIRSAIAKPIAKSSRSAGVASGKRSNPDPPGFFRSAWSTPAWARPLSTNRRSPWWTMPVTAPPPTRGLIKRQDFVELFQRLRALENVLWSVLNSKEFQLNH